VSGPGDGGPDASAVPPRVAPRAVPRVAAIVLAGGRSRRFGSDKLAAVIDGATLLERAVAAAASVADEVVVVLPPEGGSAPAPARIVRDPAPDGGPLVGLLAGLRAVDAPVAIVVAGDMPWLAPPVLAALVAALDGDAAVLEERAEASGIARLPFAIGVDAGRAAAAALLERDERRLGRLLDRLVASVVAEATWRPLDPGGRTTRDVDEPGDLAPD
jgi:molybdopterin-guanine dinucleotide biosynthesis protein A